jgi:hypothetical protein
MLFQQLKNESASLESWSTGNSSSKNGAAMSVGSVPISKEM